MKKLFAIFLGLIIGLTSFNLTSCTYLYNNTSSYSVGDTKYVMKKVRGTVEKVRYVKLRDSGIGTAVGAVLGGLAGHFIGEGKGNLAATVIGALGGAFIGYTVASQANAQELHVILDNGESAVVVVRGTEFRPGDRVEIILYGNQVKSVTKL